jgi:uncharacterized membrane protein
MNSSTMSSDEVSSEKRHLTDVGKFWIAYLFFVLCLTVSSLNFTFAASYRDTPLGYISGFLLLLAAYLIWMMRRAYRQGTVKDKR